jgi:hypothetical protein
MAHIVWRKGGSADLVAIADDLTTVRSTVPSAPGSRLMGELASGVGGDGGDRVWIKVHRCRKDGDVFIVEGRLLDATRELRDKLATLVPTPAA